MAESHKQTHRFPLQMFATAAIISGVMVFVISAVFTQANAPCLSHYSVNDSVIVDTSSSSPQATIDNHPLIICNRNNQQISWLTWLLKQSDSVQFHYLDLIELLSRK